MDHNALKEKLFLYLDEETSADEKREISFHLNGCSECRQILDRLKQMKTALTKTELEPSGTFVYKVMGRLAPQEAAAVPFELPGFLKWLLPTAGYALAIILMVNAIASRQTPVNTETILLTDVPSKAQWSFSDQSPEINNLMGG